MADHPVEGEHTVPVTALLSDAVTWSPPADFVLGAEGIWVGPESDVSYPDGGHESLPNSPSNSWWYEHRGRVVLRAAARAATSARVIWDIGGGTGLMSHVFRRAGWFTAVVEPVHGAARHARRNADAVFAGRLEELALPNAAVPAIGLFDVIEHLDDPVSTLAECQRVLSPDGFVIVTVPAHSWLWSETDEAAGHKRRYTKSSIAQESHEAGLVCVGSEYFFSLPAIGAIPLRVLRDRWRSTHNAAGTLEREARLLAPSTLTNSALRLAMRAEYITSQVGSAPFGLSLLAVLRAHE